MFYYEETTQFVLLQRCSRAFWAVQGMSRLRLFSDPLEHCSEVKERFRNSRKCLLMQCSTWHILFWPESSSSISTTTCIWWLKAGRKFWNRVWRQLAWPTACLSHKVCRYLTRIRYPKTIESGVVDLERDINPVWRKWRSTNCYFTPFFLTGSIVYMGGTGWQLSGGYS